MKKKLLELTKRNQMLLLIIVAIILSLSIFLSYAYLSYKTEDFESASLGGVGDVVQGISFPEAVAMNLSVNDENFTPATNTGNISSTFESVVGIHSGEGTLYEDSYALNLEFDNNTFEYLQTDENGNDIPELILTITYNGEELTDLDIPDLDYVTVEGIDGEQVTGFDITTITDQTIIIEDILVSSDVLYIKDEWEFTITYMAYDYDQSKNANKEFSGAITFLQMNLGNVVLLNYGGKSYVETLEVDFDNDDMHEVAGMYAAEDNYGTTYYFRGAVEDNWVYWADTYWRILRIDGEGNVRLVSQESTEPTAFSSKTGLPEYSGYMYERAVIHGHSTSSDLKLQIDSYFEEYLIDYEGDLADTIYCDNRSYYGFDENFQNAYLMEKYSSTTTIQGGNAYKIFGLKEEDFICEHEDDQFTTSANNGNGALKYPVFTISYADLHFVGTEESAFIFNGETNWTIDMLLYAQDQESLSWIGVQYIVKATEGAYLATVDEEHSGRMVLSLDADLKWASGDGTEENPYTIVSTVESTVEES